MNELSKIDVSFVEYFNASSSKFEVEPEKVYQWNLKAVGIKGREKSAYFTLIFLNNEEKEIIRRIRFINDFSGSLQEYRIIVPVPLDSKYVVLGYRINCEGATPSDIILELPPIDSQTLQIVNKQTKQEYDDAYNYKKTWEGVDLEKNFWSQVGGFKNAEEFHELGSFKVNLLKQFGLKPMNDILDIGCGTGILIESLKNYLTSPKNYVGTDIAPEAIEYCKKKFPDFEFHVNSKNEIPLLNRKFDVICFFSVFTHLYPEEIMEYLKSTKKYLKTNGFIVADIIKNPNLLDHTGTRDKVEMNEEYFFSIIKKIGFSKISQYQNGKTEGQIAYKIWDFVNNE